MLLGNSSLNETEIREDMRRRLSDLYDSSLAQQKSLELTSGSELVPSKPCATLRILFCNVAVGSREREQSM